MPASGTVPATTEAHWLASPAGRVKRIALRDALGYLDEYLLPLRRCCGPCARAFGGGANSAEREAVREAVDGSDVMIFKKEGCGYCLRAEELLSQRGVPFSSAVGDGAQTRTVLYRELRLPLVTYPLIFVRGVFLGGSDQLVDALDSGMFDKLLGAPRKPFPTGVFAMPDPLRLLCGPRGQPWY
ncbi:unnamed protein product [Polarella glacialis]|uniref:Glutaredoxin domain-containing protein n=2 Tax=Polarella glacialis TaxID=89957 RepID=A0A813GKP5_POLGL|nr:unnamed protein product [Polarella glacialis]